MKNYLSKYYFDSTKQLLRKMRLTFLSLLISVSSLFASNVDSQVAKVSINIQDQSILDVVQAIEKQTDYLFVYDKNDIDLDRKLSLVANDISVADVLSGVFNNTNVVFAKVGSNIILMPKTSIPQQQRISGTVTDATNGDPIIGANVIVEGTALGVITDLKGKFSIDLPDANSTIIISYVGYNTETIQINGETNIEVKLVPDITNLDEIVVVGYGVQRKSDLTGAVASIKSDDIKNLSVQSMNEALQGRVAGVYVTKGEGRPGNNSNIIIRGAASINGMGPLYIVDGVATSTGNNFNIKDIESIEILKDAGSCAIYGAQSAGGVVLITTKRGASADKMKIDFSANYGVRTATNLYDLLDTEEFIKAKKAAGWNYPSWDDPSLLPNTNWVDELFDSGKDQNYNLSLSGGNSKMTYFISGNYEREDGVRIDNWFQRYSLRLNSDYRVNKRLKIGESIYLYKTGENAAEGGGIPFRSVPTMDVYDISNPYGGWGRQPVEGYYEGPNPKASELGRHRTNNDYGINGNVFADLEILTGLNFKTTLSGYIGNNNRSDFEEAYYYGSLSKPEASFSKNFGSGESYMANFVLTYARAFGKHEVKLMAGYEASKGHGTDLYGATSQFTVPIAQSFNLSTRSERSASGSISNGRGLSQFGRINYGFAGKYLFTANIRRDGSDKFGKENRWGVFPAFNLGWRISEENFVKNGVPQISNLKIRGGWGILGSDNLNQFLYEPAYDNLDLHSFDGTIRSTGWGVVKFPNNSIKWEEVRSTNIGFDLGLFNNKLSITTDWYVRNTLDMIYQIQLPLSSGIGKHNSNPDRVPVNLGKIQNKGIEFAVNYNNTYGQLKINLGVNGSFNKNLVEKLSDDNVPIYEGQPTPWNASIGRTESGQPMGQFWGFIAEGIFQNDAEIQARNNDAKQRAIANGSAEPTDEVYYQQKQTGAGDLKYSDIDGDGRITDEDKTYIGNPWPKMLYGFNVNLEYKGFDLGIFLQGAFGNEIYNAARGLTQNLFGDNNTTSDVFAASNFNGNGITSQPRLGFDESGSYVRDPNGNFKNPSSFFVEKGSYMKLRNLQVGYTLPKAIVGRLRITSARVYLSGQNILTFTKYKGLDPEIGGGVKSQGIDDPGTYPHTRLISFGVELGL